MSTTTRPASPATPAVGAPAGSPWRAFAVCLALTSIGVLVASIADAVSRSGGRYGDAIFWTGAAFILIPWTLRLTGQATSRRERIGALVVVCLGLYLAKFFEDPTRFMYADELVHAYNADTIVRTGGLFHPNPILAITPDYPGLEAVTAAVADTGHMSTFAAGMIVVGAARLIMILALFRMTEVLTGSDRYAGLAALIYTTSPNYLFFTAQFSYESLALPLMVASLFAVLAWMEADDPRLRRAWTCAGAILIAGVVVTHHMTAYVLIAALVILTAVARIRRERPPYHLTLLAAAITTAWLVVVASKTVGYLSPVFTNALKSTLSTVLAETAPRAVLKSGRSGIAQPVGYRVIATGTAVLVVVGIIAGLRLYWRSGRRTAATLVLAAASLAYVAALATRLVPRAWEIADRSSEFLSIGVCFILAGSVIGLILRDPASLRRRVLASVAICFAFAGGIVIGHPTDLLLAQPLEVRAAGRTIPSPGLGAVEWFSSHLGAGRRVGADRSTSRLLLQFDEKVFSGHHPDIHDILISPALPPWQVRQLREASIHYVVVDRLAIGDDQSRGYYFCGVVAVSCVRSPRGVWRKFEREAQVSRIFDNGRIAIYDVRRLVHAR